MNLFSQLSFKTKLLLTVGFACFICGVISLLVATHYNNIEFRNGLVEKSTIIHGRLDVAAKYVAEQGGLKPMIERYTEKYKDPSQLTEEDKKIILQQVPIYAAMKIGSEESTKDYYNFRIFSDEPRNKNNAATSEELEIFKKFQNDPNLKELVSEDEKFVTVYRPVRLTENRGCLTCHGNPSTSPWGNGKDILGYKMEDWKDGKLHGVFAISNNIATIRKAAADKGGVSSTAMLSIFIILGGIVALFMATFIVKGPIDILSSIVRILSQSGEEVASASTKIAMSSEELSQAATEQAASLEETAASVEEMNSMIVKNSENAKSAEETSSKSQNAVAEGKEVIQKMMAAMQAINKCSEGMSETVKVIEQIDKKTKVINEIVNKTELLSFNASVEAARAGEHGKGFAVVAEEVGNLARMSGSAAEEIATLLEESLNKVNQMVADTKKNVDAGTAITQECGEVFEEVVQNVTKVSGMAAEISSASEEQARGINEITKAMNQLDQMTQQNAATSEESASAAEALTVQSDALKNAVNQLVQTIHGPKKQEPPHADISSDHQSQTRKHKTNFKSKTPQNVVHLKTPRESAKIETLLKKVSGDTPSYDSDGFEDV